MYFIYVFTYIYIVRLVYFMSIHDLIFLYIWCSFIIIVKHRCSKMEGSCSSQQSRSKKKNRPVGPIQIHTDGKPVGPHYDALVDHIARHVSYCNEFLSLLSWPEHKNTGRVEGLYRELTISYLAY